MTYSVKKQPKKIYESITYEFTIVDEEGKEYEIRKWEDTNGGGYYIHENGMWIDYSPNDELDEFINEDLEY